MPDILDDLKKLEKSIDYWGDSDDYFKHIPGTIPILISAPHGGRHLRNGIWREEDEYTASIAIKLGQLTGAHVIYVNNKTEEDSNDAEVTSYKKAMAEIVKKHNIKFVADIHGAADYNKKHNRNNEFSVCVGTRDDKGPSCPSFLHIIKECLKNLPEPSAYNLRDFKAMGKGTITTYANCILGIESAQFEITARYRIVKRKPDSTIAREDKAKANYRAEDKNVLAIIQGLQKMINAIKKEIEAKHAHG